MDIGAAWINEKAVGWLQKGPDSPATPSPTVSLNICPEPKTEMTKCYLCCYLLVALAYPVFVNYLTKCLKINGGPGRIRTFNPLLRRQMLYPLSYGTVPRQSTSIL